MLLQSQSKSYGIKAAEDEIIATASIESIDFSRDSVRNILKGFAPKDEQENRILGIKQGLEFIADTTNNITEENLYALYKMTVDDFLPDEDKLNHNNYYRHDEVFIVSDRIEHSGLDYKKVPKYMKTLIHFYIAYVHPYFDGNGRMARLVHLWYLIQKGYQSALFIPFSSQIEKNRKAYYDAYTAIEENRKYSGVIDVTPFVLYFIEYVYNRMSGDSTSINTIKVFDSALKDGKITEKEVNLWKFVLSCYGTEEFSTKQIEKDFGDAAYATIRAFVLKFEKLGLLTSAKYGNRVKYKVN